MKKSKIKELSKKGCIKYNCAPARQLLDEMKGKTYYSVYPLYYSPYGEFIFDGELFEKTRTKLIEIEKLFLGEYLNPKVACAVALRMSLKLSQHSIAMIMEITDATLRSHEKKIKKKLGIPFIKLF